jgi:HSP20 family molecular chaperone IbpA
MSKANVSITTTNSIIDDIMRRQDMIARRAFEIFQGHMENFTAQLDDWLMAEREVSAQPGIDLRREDGKFEIDATLPDIDPKKLEVKVTAEDVLITAEREAPKPETSKTASEAGVGSDGKVRYFSAIHLPEAIDPDGVQASFNKGTLHLTAKIAKVEPRNVEVKV